jgi:ABC-2 type transport system ATP-binding protein
MTESTDVLVVEVAEGTDELVARLGELGITVIRDGAILQVPLSSQETYDVILGAVAELDLPLHSLDQRRHRVSELFSTSPATPQTGASQAPQPVPQRGVEEASHVG